MRNRLIELIGSFPTFGGENLKEKWMPEAVERLAQHLLANGVIVQAQGHWKQFHPKWFDTFICSECEMIVNIETPFCPKCGAKMSDVIERSNENAE